MDVLKQTVSKNCERIETMNEDIGGIKKDINGLKKSHEETRVEVSGLSGKLDILIGHESLGNKIGMATFIAILALTGTLIGIVYQLAVK